MIFYLAERKCAACKAFFRTYKDNPYEICAKCRKEYRQMLKQGKVSGLGIAIVEKWLKIK